MTVKDSFELSGGKDKYWELYKSFENILDDWMMNNKFDHSEKSFECIKMIANDVIENIGESWYRRSLNKGFGLSH